jgi:hypothetical protein
MKYLSLFLLVSLLQPAAGADANWPRLIRITFDKEAKDTEIAEIGKRFGATDTWQGEVSITALEASLDHRVHITDEGQTGSGKKYQEWAVPLGQEDMFAERLRKGKAVVAAERISTVNRGADRPPNALINFQRKPALIKIARVANESFDALVSRVQQALKGRFPNKNVIPETIEVESGGRTVFSIYHLQKEVMPKYWQWVLVDLDFQPKAEFWQVEMVVDANVASGLGSTEPALSEYIRISDADGATALRLFQAQLVEQLSTALRPN